MPINATQIRVAGSGAIWKAPLGTTIPADEVAAYGTGWVNLGFAEDGFKIKQDLKTSEITGWQSLDRLRIINESLYRTVSFTSLQSSKETVQLAWGGATITPGTGPKYTLALADPSVVTEFMLGLDWTDGITIQRIIIARAALLTLPELTYTRKDAVKYPLEIAALVPASGNAFVIAGTDTNLIA